MNKYLIAALLFAVSMVAQAVPNIIMKSWDWNTGRSQGLNTIEHGGFTAGSVVVVSFKAAFAASGNVSVAPWPAGVTEHGCTTTTSISAAPNDFSSSAIKSMTGQNQGISFQAGGKQVARGKDKRTGKPFYLHAPLEVSKSYYINFKAEGAGCGDYRVQYSVSPL